MSVWQVVTGPTHSHILVRASYQLHLEREREGEREREREREGERERGREGGRREGTPKVFQLDPAVKNNLSLRLLC